MDFLGVNAHRSSLAEPQHQVAVVNAVAHQGRDAVEHQAADLDRQVATGMHRHDLSDLPLVDRLLGQRHSRVEPADVSDHEVPGGVASRGEDLIAVGGGRRHRFFQEHVLAAAQRIDGDVAVVVDVRRDPHYIDFRVGQQLAIVGVSAGDVESVGHFGQSLRTARAQGGQFDAGHRG